MNDDRAFERATRDWLESGSDRTPARVTDAVLLAVRTTPQQRGLRIPWRSPTMNPFTRVAAVAVAVIAVLVGSIYVLVPRGGVGGPPVATPSPSAPPSPSPTATAVPSPTPAALAGEGDVFPGTYVPQFDPGLTFTIEHEVEHNCAPGFQCRGSIDVNIPGWLGLEFGQPAIEFAMIRVDKVDDPANPGSQIDPPADLAAWIASRPGLTVLAQKSVTVGGRAGSQLDIRTGSTDVSFGPIPGVTDVGNGLSANGVHRLIVITLGGRQVLLRMFAGSGSVEELQPLVDSIVWN